MSIIIAGGGIAGATLALAISHITKGKLAMTLIEANEPVSHMHLSYDKRAIALAIGTCQQLASINLWSLFSPYATAITDIHISDQGHASFLSFTMTEYNNNVNILGYVIQLHEIGKLLFERLKKSSDIVLRCPNTVINIERTIEHVSVTLDNGDILYGKVLIAADGSNSTVATACDIQWKINDYKQIAVITNITTSEKHYGRAFERFTQYGPLALLPISNDRSAVVWCQPLSKKLEIDHWNDLRFTIELQRAFGWRLGRIIQVDKRHSYLLKLQTAVQRISHRVALVGNAAQTLHPIAGQGFNLGMRDVISLAETLSLAWYTKKDIGTFTTLQQYQQRRSLDSQFIINLTDTLVRVFSNNYTPLVIGRNLGLLAMNYFPILRNLFAKHTMGWVKY